MKLTKLFALAAMAAAPALASAFTVENLYLIGQATPANWLSSNPTPMTKVSDNVWEYTGALTTGEFKFLTQRDNWTPTVMAAVGGTELGKAGLTDSPLYLSENGDPDNKWNVTEAGIYKITVNTEASTITAEWQAEMPAVVYALGSAVGSWNSNDVSRYAWKNADGKYVWEGYLAYDNDDKLIKFVAERGEWNAVSFYVPETVDYNGNVSMVEPGQYKVQLSREDQGGLKDWFWGLKPGKSGVYRLLLDTEALTLDVQLIRNTSVEFVPDDVTALYMLGLVDGVNSSFDSNDPKVEMTAAGNGIFEWEGDIDYASTDGNPNNANKQFKFITSKGDWNKVWYLIPSAATADGYIETVTPGNSYDLNASSWLNGTGKDAFFGVPADTKGHYKVSVDLNTMKMTFSNASAVEEIEAAEAAEALWFNLQGVRVANPGNGVFVKVQNGKALKVVK